MKIYECISVLVALTLLSGCKSGPVMIGAMEGVNVESETRFTGGIIGFDQMQTTNVSGMLPFTQLGQMYRMKSNRRPSMAVPISEGPSQIVDITYESSAEMSDLIAIREKILAARTQGTVYVLKKITRIRLVNELAGLERIDSNKLSTEQVKRVKVLPEMIASAAVEEKQAKVDLAKAEQAAQRANSKENVIIFSWYDAKESGWSWLFSGLLSLRFSEEQQRSGSVILSGLKMSYLRVGSDILDAHSKLNKTTSRPVLTQTWRARHILSLSSFEREQELSALVEASYSELTNLPETIRELEKIEIEAALTRVTNLTNISALSSPVIHKPRKVDWDNLMVTADTDGITNTFFSVHTHYNDLRKLVKQKQ